MFRCLPGGVIFLLPVPFLPLPVTVTNTSPEAGGPHPSPVAGVSCWGGGSLTVLVAGVSQTGGLLTGKLQGEGVQRWGHPTQELPHLLVGLGGPTQGHPVPCSSSGLGELQSCPSRAAGGEHTGTACH